MHNCNPPPPYSLLLRQLSSELLQQRTEAGEFVTLTEKRISCPACGSTSLRQRRQKKPAYKCQSCRSEFETPRMNIVDTGRLSREDWDRFWGKYGGAVKERVSGMQKELGARSMDPENYVAMCRRCHMAARGGLVLCPVCRKGYMREGRDMCWTCFTKTEKGKEVARMFEKETVHHPWCGKDFAIERRWLDILSEPSVLCIEICELGPENCSDARQHIEPQ